MNSLAKFNEYLDKRGFHKTKQRDLIAAHFLNLKKRHISAEELYFNLVNKYPFIGRVTVYRTLKLLTDAGLAEESQFGENHLHYESTSNLHHDHFVCTNCGEIIEFKSLTIEKQQEDLARKHNFDVHLHRLEIFGTCAKCKKGEK
ncbi:MAG: transcriptional repressor [Actinobacteria bacterium]|nr:MAG: transcriptional repressor [Actinomycetota bacterium]